jgi:hypothetical protein
MTALSFAAGVAWRGDRSRLAREAGLGALAGKSGAFVALTAIIAALALWTAGYAASLRRSSGHPEGDAIVRWSSRNCDSVSR